MHEGREVLQMSKHGTLIKGVSDQESKQCNGPIRGPDTMRSGAHE